MTIVVNTNTSKSFHCLDQLAMTPVLINSGTCRCEHLRTDAQRIPALHETNTVDMP